MGWEAVTRGRGCVEYFLLREVVPEARQSFEDEDCGAGVVDTCGKMSTPNFPATKFDWLFGRKIALRVGKNHLIFLITTSFDDRCTDLLVTTALLHIQYAWILRHGQVFRLSTEVEESSFRSPWEAHEE